ncbi:MAG: DNA polymerase/3'-5' exonuclease PolX [Gemmatimonadota bacterium]|nr:DNA polymerase/3'-5' exonuclease PolX [Gemmatimonadota bacterium]
MENIEIAGRLREVANLLEILDANPFRVRAYRNAIRTIGEHAVPMRKLVADGTDLTELPSIGKGMAENIRELVETGELSLIDELIEEYPALVDRDVVASLIEITRIPGIGPKKVRKLWEELGVESVDDLREAAAAGSVAELEGFGEKTEVRILEEIERLATRTSRFRLGDVDELLPPLLEHIRGIEGVRRLEVAGSYRRRRETVGDIDLLVLADDAVAVSEGLTSYEGVERVIGAGGTKTSVLLRSGLQVDLRVVPDESWGAALVYFTGSKEHNIKLRQRALERDLRVSEYGVFEIPEAERDEGVGERGSASSGAQVAGATEEDVYDSLGLPWMAPEVREDRGEIAAALGDGLPTLIEVGDLKGDLHMHSTWSDGRNTIEEMLEACVARGYEYFCMSDHSKALAMVEGLDATRLRQQWAEMKGIAGRHPEIRMLRSMEVDILKDGSLDLEDELLEELDWVTVSVHSFFGLPAVEQTDRVLRALAHPSVNVFGHPTGRIINRRGPIEIEIDEILQACAEHGVAVEINSHPNRLDLRDTHAWRARELGVPVVISTDAHRIEELDQIHYGVEQGRRAWLTPDDVLNTRPLDDLLAWAGS